MNPQSTMAHFVKNWIAF